jgi:hypothetical protein
VTSAEKLALFRSLFRGRDEIYPRFWSNARTGRKGYAPACANEWVRGVCEKPRVKCGECPHHAFLPVDDQVILDHLQGRHVVGIYPLLTDETCWFAPILAVLRSSLDSWRGIGAVERGMAQQGYDLQLTRYDARGWRATFYTTSLEHSPTSATRSAFEPTPWRAV